MPTNLEIMKPRSTHYISTFEQILTLRFSQYLAPRAAAFEHRLVAVLAIDSVYDFGNVFLTQLPTSLTTLFKSGNATAFDKVMEEVINNTTTPTQLRWIFQQGMWSFDTASPYNFLNQTFAYTLEGVIDQINGPVFLVSAQDD